MVAMISIFVGMFIGLSFAVVLVNPESKDSKAKAKTKRKIKWAKTKAEKEKEKLLEKNAIGSKDAETSKKWKTKEMIQRDEKVALN